MAKVIAVELQGVSYRWNGEHIVIAAGADSSWIMEGASLEQLELVDEEGEVEGLFSIDFERQQWRGSGRLSDGELTLIGDDGSTLAPGPEEPLPLLTETLELPVFSDIGSTSDADRQLADSVLEDIFEQEPLPLPAMQGGAPPPASLDSELINDVVNWLDVYSHHG
ncbi:hypothetical protein C7H85_00010 [Zobellella endophytica]|uniref:Uncharacterized protein n=1 Tax=Zobellella endophytica TaxID=2116700 RepID=A0A2P7RAQ4_9GAMM|nr:hypothetical protein [Zobellella endophytica]PSJ47263.1 hypothetical protein C7H85_00010 [Zobellella endophytica]